VLGNKTSFTITTVRRVLLTSSMLKNLLHDSVPFLSTNTMFYDIFDWAYLLGQFLNEKVTYILGFSFFFHPFFFSSLNLFVAEIDLLLGLCPIQNL